MGETYAEVLKRTLKLGIKGGLAKGVGLGATAATLNLADAALLFCGGVVIRDGYSNGAVALSTIFTIIVGSLYVRFQPISFHVKRLHQNRTHEYILSDSEGQI